jgi:hypothetical protein
MNIKDLFINTLKNEFGFPVILQGSMSDDDEYPDSFFTFFNNSTTSEAFYDNKETETVWDFDLNFYSNNPDLVNSILLEAKTSLKAHGFIIDGKGYDVLSDEPTHTGRGINVLFVENEGGLIL